jgi:hypothetical protein
LPKGSLVKLKRLIVGLAFFTNILNRPEFRSMILNNVSSNQPASFGETGHLCSHPNTIRPMPAPNAQLANAAYKTFLDGLAQGNQDCIAKLNEARDRFMESDCGFPGAQFSKRLQERLFKQSFLERTR